MLKIHHGQKDKLENKLVKSLFTGEFDKRDQDDLKPKGNLTLCGHPSAPDVQSTPHGK